MCYFGTIWSANFTSVIHEINCTIRQSVADIFRVGMGCAGECLQGSNGFQRRNY